jgi:hypothetical protein
MHIKAFIVAAALALGTAGPASAIVRTITYEGVIGEGYDNTNVFGLGRDAYLSGRAFTAVVTTDDQRPGVTRSSVTYPGITADALRGAATATLTIGAQTFRFDGPSFVEFDDVIDREGFIQQLSQGGSFMGFELHSPGEHVAGPYWYSPTSSELSSLLWYYRASFEIYDHSVWASPKEANGTFLIQSIRVQDPAAATVPEPATWALMLIGFGALGAVMRSRRLGQTGWTA